MNQMYGENRTRILKKIEYLPFSPIREMDRFADAQVDVIPSWFGEPEVNTPEFIRGAAKSELDRGEIFYTTNSGFCSLREAIAEYMNGLYKTWFSTSQITVPSSCMNALMFVAQSLVSPGSRVVILPSSWPNIPAVQKILGAEITVVPINLSPKEWVLDLDSLIEACDEKTSAIVINSPNNPSGWMIKTKEQQSLLEIARKQGIWIVNDEVYARITYGPKHSTSFCEVMEEGDRVIVVKSFSKSWTMTGWRLGWITAPKGIENQIEKLTEYNIAGSPTLVQHAGIKAIKEVELFINVRANRYLKLRNLFEEWAKSHPRLVYTSLTATFYVFLK